MNSFTSALSSGETPPPTHTPGLANMMELFLKGLGMYQVACIPVDITHKKSVKRCSEGQMKKHLEAYWLDEGMPTDFLDGKGMLH